jgi:hypothetical protein
MKKSQTLKLTGYSAMASAFLAISNDGKSQTIYFDIAPNLIMDVGWNETQHLDLDMNLDGITDFQFTEQDYDPCSYCVGWAYDKVSPWGANQISYMVYSWEQYFIGWTSELCAIPNDSGMIIDPALDFTSDPVKLKFFDATLFSSFGDWYGPWAGISGFHYVGVKLSIDGSYHYGWIRLKSYGTFFELDSYAYNINPEEEIVVGEIPTCNPPMPNGESAITSTTAKLKWLSAIDVDHYELQYRAVGAATWITKEVAAIKTFRKVAGLVCGANYEWQIRTVCLDGETSAYSPIQNFTTAVCRIVNENIIDEENIEIYSYSNQLYVNIDEDIIEPLQLLIFDYLGRKILEKEIIDQQNIIELNVADGIYIVKISNGESVVENKIMLQR